MLLKISQLNHKLSVSYGSQLDVINFRNKETEAINNFVDQFLDVRVARVLNTLYIAGLPGNGKTLVVTSFLKKKSLKNSNLSVIFINVASLKNPKHVFIELCKALNYPTKSVMEALETLEGIVSSNNPLKTKYVLCLDEIDFLVSANKAIFYNLVDLISRKASSFSLIGISNSLHLLNDLEEKLKSRLAKVEKLFFDSYTAEALEAILRERLADTDVFSEKALEFLGKKVASVFGDVRKVLQMASMSLEHLEEESKGSALELAKNKEGLLEIIKLPKKGATIEERASRSPRKYPKKKVLRVEIEHVVSAAKKMNESPIIYCLSLLSLVFKRVLVGVILLCREGSFEWIPLNVLRKKVHSLAAGKGKRVSFIKEEALHRVVEELARIDILSLRVSEDSEVSVKLNIFLSDAEYGLKRDVIGKGLFNK